MCISDKKSWGRTESSLFPFLLFDRSFFPSAFFSIGEFFRDHFFPIPFTLVLTPFSIPAGSSLAASLHLITRVTRHSRVLTCAQFSCSPKLNYHIHRISHHTVIIFFALDDEIKFFEESNTLKEIRES